MDTLGIEPKASRMLSGCDTTTPCAHLHALADTDTMHLPTAEIRSWSHGFFIAKPCNAAEAERHAQDKTKHGAVIAEQFGKMDTLGFEPRAFRMRSGCDTTTPCAHLHW